MVLFGADSRDVRHRTYGREVAIGIAIAVGLCAVIYAAVWR